MKVLDSRDRLNWRTAWKSWSGDQHDMDCVFVIVTTQSIHVGLGWSPDQSPTTTFSIARETWDDTPEEARWLLVINATCFAERKVADLLPRWTAAVERGVRALTCSN